jgi:transcriptional regulator with XRE-family HTH domain
MDADDADRVAGALLRSARRRAGLTQAELADRADVPRSVLSAYENGRRQPSVAMLARLAAAGGLTLHLSARRTLDLERNAQKLVDVLSLVDAIPMKPRRGQLPLPVDWKAVGRGLR